MSEVLSNRERIDMRRGFLAATVQPDRDRVFDAWGATVIGPTELYWRAVAAEYPDETVMLS
jgi:hypothetical protein